MVRKICVVTGSRADYGLLRLIMTGIKNDPQLDLQVIATGMHLSPTFGLTYTEIEADGFSIDFKIETLTSSDSPVGIAESISQGVSGCASAFEQLKPDIILLLGDRYEIFAAAAAALVAKIPIAHLHGGESTIGAFDEAIRHSITKMSHLHFVAADEYKSRVIQLGEDANNVFLVGGLGVDAIKEIELLSKKDLESSLEIEFQVRSLLITFNPATLESDSAEMQIRELLTALSNLRETTLIFTMPNADTGGLVLMKSIQEFVLENKHAHSFISLGQQRYLSCISHVDGVVGNSSSGLTEVPSFKKGTVNIGSRQLGRLQSLSVINCEPDHVQIRDAIEMLYSEDFQLSLESVINPYGEGGASGKILEVLKNASLDDIILKTFHDL
jgi:GDP/UDP-N,N'-diacetylbacillosamine 2-epimerase (hydrolysing)